MPISRHFSGLREFRDRVPRMALYRLLFRIAVWRVCKLLAATPTVHVHARSRMRLRATANEHGIQTGIFLFKDAYEPSVRAAIDRFVRGGACCFDIGANVGLWSLRMAECAGQGGRVFAFEPFSKNLRDLTENAALSGLTNIRVMPFALGDSDTEATLYIPGDAGRSALAAESSLDARESIVVKRLDDVWKEQGCPAVSFVKMDVEGAEPLVLRGGRAFFESARPVTCCEINPGKLRNMGFVPHDVYQIFLSLRYRVLVWSHEAGDLIPYRLSDDHLESTLDLVFIPGP